MAKYTRVFNTPRFQSDLKLMMDYLGTAHDVEMAIKYALTMCLADRVEGYNVFTGKVMKGDSDVQR